MLLMGTALAYLVLETLPCSIRKASATRGGRSEGTALGARIPPCEADGQCESVHVQGRGLAWDSPEGRAGAGAEAGSGGGHVHPWPTHAHVWRTTTILHSN